MTDRERLIELCDEKIRTMKFQNSDHWFDFTEKIKGIADYLLANGVIVAPMPMAEWLRQELTEYVYKRCVEEL